MRKRHFYLCTLLLSIGEKKAVELRRMHSEEAETKIYDQ